MTPERLDELYTTVLELLLEVGYERLTLDQVAARAHTSKMTLYRQWNGKAGLVASAMRHHKVPPQDYSAHASLEETFEAMSAVSDTEPPRDARLTFTLLHAAATEPEVGVVLREALIEPAVRSLAEIFERAADRGEIARDPELFERLTYTIVEHFVLLGMLDGRSDTAEARRAFYRTVIRPALTYLDTPVHD